MKNDFISVLAFKWAGYDYACGGDYNSLNWMDHRPKPSFEDFEKADEEYSQYLISTAYRHKRASEYPPIPDQLDMMYHDFDGWIATIKAIKDKYPKGE